MLPTSKPITLPDRARTRRPVRDVVKKDSKEQPIESCYHKCPEDRDAYVCYTEPGGRRFTLTGTQCQRRCLGYSNTRPGYCPEHGKPQSAWVTVRENDKVYDTLAMFFNPPPGKKFSKKFMYFATYGRRGTEADFPFQDIGGYKSKVNADQNEWKVWRDDDFIWWKPYGPPGAVYEDGGLLPDAPGELPVVDPPKDRYGAPYFMEPRWLKGNREVNEYYKKNCPIRVHGRLHYEGPYNICANASFDSDTTAQGEKELCAPEAGGYSWGWLEKFPGGRYNDRARIGPTMMPSSPVDASGKVKRDKYGRHANHRKIDREKAEFYLKWGYELPPWYRAGPDAVPDLIRKHCPPSPDGPPKPGTKTPTDAEIRRVMPW